MRLGGLASLLWLPPALAAVQPGELAPTVTGRTLDGQAFDLVARRGQVVYLDFWASWCAPCRRVLPQLDATYQALRGEGLLVVGVNVDANTDDARAFLKRWPVSFPALADPTWRWAETFALPGMPSGYLIDRQGVVRYVQRGTQDHDLDRLMVQIRQLLEEKP